MAAWPYYWKAEDRGAEIGTGLQCFKVAQQAARKECKASKQHG